MVFPQWPGRALGVAGTALEWKCTSEEFLFSFRECHKRPSWRFCFCEERSVVSVFSLEAGGLHICRALAGRGAAGRLLQGLQTEPGRDGHLLGISPQTPGNGLPAHQALGQPCLTGQAGWSRGG